MLHEIVWLLVAAALTNVAIALRVVRALKDIDPTTNIVVLTGYGSIATASKA